VLLFLAWLSNPREYAEEQSGVLDGEIAAEYGQGQVCDAGVEEDGVKLGRPHRHRSCEGNGILLGRRKNSI